jgi:DNA-binding CsgD family transcriptional regulator
LDAEFLARAEAMFLDAATDPDAWQAALDAVAVKTNSLGAALVTIEGRGPFVLPTQDVGELAERYVKDGWYQRDFRYAGIPRLKEHGLFVDQDIVKPDEMDKMAYYADFLQPMGVGWSACLRVDPSIDDLWCLAFHRSMADGPYQKEEQDSILRLRRMVSRAAALARQLEFIRLDGAMDVAGGIAGACMFIDRFGRAVRLNQAAEAMVGRCFSLREGRIDFAHASNLALRRHIDAAIWPDLAADAAAHRPVVVPQPGGRPLIFQALRLRGRSLGLFAPAHAMLLVTDLNDKTAPQVDLLQTVFKLTVAEARLCNALLQQFSLVDAAAYLNCSHETVRTQLKAIFAKTGTRTQVQLVELLGRLHTGFGA